MSLAPICLSTYARVEHLKQTIAALEKNTLASQTDLYVFSDAPKLGDEEKVQAVRAFLKTVDGFKRVEIVERQTNSRVYNNRQGMQMLLDQYGKVIFLEEDNITAPSFLEFMNSALDKYENDPRIFSITGHCPQINIPKAYKYDIFTHPRFDPWGFGIWKNRFSQIEMQIPQTTIKYIYLNFKNLYQFSRGGIDLIPVGLNNYFGYGDGLDTKISAKQFVDNTLTVYPVKRLVRNIGLDGSGAHKRADPNYKIDLWEEKFQPKSYPESLEPNPEIMNSMYEFRSGNSWNRFRKIGRTIIIILRKILTLLSPKL